MFKRCLPLLATLVFAGQLPQAWAQPVTASYQSGLVSIRCDNATLASVFAKLEEIAGIELILEDAVKNKRLTADLQQVPIAMAVQRLLEGNGVNFAVMMDPRDWGKVATVFVGTGGGGPSRPAAPPRRPPIEPDPADDGYDDFDDADMLDDESFDDMDDMNGDLVDDPNAVPEDFAPPGSSPVPSYLPPQQSFPRSSFAPAAPTYPVTGQQQQQQQQQPDQTPPPPATMPFMDALGRPIPVPPELNQQQQQQRRRQQQQQ